MASKKSNPLKLILVSFLLGCAAYYIFLCFMGVVYAFLIDTGVDLLIIKKILRPLSNGDVWHLVLYVYFTLIYMAVGLTVLFLATYFLSNFLSERLVMSTAGLTLGALCIDLLYLPEPPFDVSFFFLSKYNLDFVRLIIWTLSTMAAIYLGYMLQKKKANKNVYTDS